LDLGELIAGHQSNLYAFIYRMTGDRYLSEDLMQETFVRALRASRSYRAEGRLSAWLFGIAANLLKDHWRKQQYRSSAGLIDTGVEKARQGRLSDDSPEECALARADVQRLRGALLDLPFEQRAPLVLHYYHDLSYEDIARGLVIPIGTVRSRIHNGKARLRRLLEEGGYEDGRD